MIEFLALVNPGEIADWDRYRTYVRELLKTVPTGTDLLAGAAESGAARAVSSLRFMGGILAGIAVIELLLSFTREEKQVAKRAINKERRRRRTAMCANKALAIIEQRRESVTNGQFNGNELKTDDNAFRYPRKFKSRA